MLSQKGRAEGSISLKEYKTKLIIEISANERNRIKGVCKLDTQGFAGD